MCFALFWSGLMIGYFILILFIIAIIFMVYDGFLLSDVPIFTGIGLIILFIDGIIFILHYFGVV